MLRGDFIARAYVPGKATRQRKEVLRQRLYWARLRTRIRNRIHALIDRQRELAMPQCSDLFGRKALVALKKLSFEHQCSRITSDVADWKFNSEPENVTEFSSARVHFAFNGFVR
jgi:transposase